jgi:hypothetical protein
LYFLWASLTFALCFNIGAINWFAIVNLRLVGFFVFVFVFFLCLLLVKWEECEIDRHHFPQICHDHREIGSSLMQCYIMCFKLCSIFYSLSFCMAEFFGTNEDASSTSLLVILHLFIIKVHVVIKYTCIYIGIYMSIVISSIPSIVRWAVMISAWGKYSLGTILFSIFYESRGQMPNKLDILF